MTRAPCLIVFSGLPGTGKTTVSRALATRLRAFHLRIDVIEQAIRAAGLQQVGAAGYTVANAVAKSNLLLGHAVVADCVNPVRESRSGWRGVAACAGATLVDIQLVCTNEAEHRRRVEGRLADIAGHVLPTWEVVTRHEFEDRDDEHLVLDTAATTPAGLVELCATYVLEKQSRL